MERLGGEEIGRRASIRQVAFASSIGTAMEWYDFFLYGTAAALVFNRLFFPELAPLTGTLASFETAGLLAPILLVTLRFLQGFAVGGEWGGATLMAVEHAPEESRNFYASWPQIGAPSGLVLWTAVLYRVEIHDERGLAGERG
jgi:MHS family shikimate/dehydroshikimate transporter-like MFS transporter